MNSKIPTCDSWRFEADMGADVVPLDIAEAIEIELTDARAEIERLKKVSLAGMNNATKLSGAELKAAQRLRKESSPEALESERAANAVLTEELECKDKIIDQMREALQAIVNRRVCVRGKEHRIARAALEAAGRN